MPSLKEREKGKFNQNKRSRKSEKPRKNVTVVNCSSPVEIITSSTEPLTLGQILERSKDSYVDETEIKEEDLPDYEVADWFNNGPSIHKEGHSHSPPPDFIKSSPESSDTDSSPKRNKSSIISQTAYYLDENTHNGNSVGNASRKDRPITRQMSKTNCVQYETNTSAKVEIERATDYEVKPQAQFQPTIAYGTSTFINITPTLFNGAALNGIRQMDPPIAKLVPITSTILLYPKHVVSPSYPPARPCTCDDIPIVSESSDLDLLLPSPSLSVENSRQVPHFDDYTPKQASVTTPVDLKMCQLPQQPELTVEECLSRSSFRIIDHNFPVTHKVNLDVPFSKDVNLCLPVLNTAVSYPGFGQSTRCDSPINIYRRNQTENTKEQTRTSEVYTYFVNKPTTPTDPGAMSTMQSRSGVSEDVQFESPLAETLCTWSIPNSTPKMSVVEIPTKQPKSDEQCEGDTQEEIQHKPDTNTALESNTLYNPLYTLATAALSQGEITPSSPIGKQSKNVYETDLVDIPNPDVGVDNNVLDKDPMNEILEEEEESSDEWTPGEERRKRKKAKLSVVPQEPLRSASSEGVLVINESEHSVETKPKRKVAKSTRCGRPQFKPVHCAECGKVFNGQYHLKRHQLSHTQTRKFSCDICGKGFKQKSHLKGHRKVHDSDRKMENNSKYARAKKVTQKRKTVKREKPLEPRQKAGRPKKTYKEGDLSCCKCGKSFKTIYRLKRHEMSHTEERPYKCKVCGKGFKQSGHRNEHEANHAMNRRNYLCNICGMVFRCRSSFHNHTKSHQITDTGENEDLRDFMTLYRKYYATETSRSKVVQGKVQDFDNSVNSYNCPYCVDRFLTAQALNSHLDSHIEVDQRLHVQPYPCDQCHRRFTYKHNLDKHRLLHLAPEKYARYHSDKLKAHVDSGKQAWKCFICSKLFIRKETLAKHSKIHTGKKPYRCTICCRDFTQNIHLKVHMRKHTGNRPFQCSKCHKGFIDSTSLAKHVENESCHSENKVYHCKLCRKRHYYSGTIKQHIRREHHKQNVDCYIFTSARKNIKRKLPDGSTPGKAVHQCHICSQQFSERCNLVRHVRKKHPDVVAVFEAEELKDPLKMKQFDTSVSGSETDDAEEVTGDEKRSVGGVEATDVFGNQDVCGDEGVSCERSLVSDTMEIKGRTQFEEISDEGYCPETESPRSGENSETRWEQENDINQTDLIMQSLCQDDANLINVEDIVERVEPPTPVTLYTASDWNSLHNQSLLSQVHSRDVDDESAVTDSDRDTYIDFLYKIGLTHSRKTEPEELHDDIEEKNELKDSKTYCSLNGNVGSCDEVCDPVLDSVVDSTNYFKSMSKDSPSANCVTAMEVSGSKSYLGESLEHGAYEINDLCNEKENIPEIEKTDNCRIGNEIENEDVHQSYIGKAFEPRCGNILKENSNNIVHCGDQDVHLKVYQDRSLNNCIRRSPIKDQLSRNQLESAQLDVQIQEENLRNINVDPATVWIDSKSKTCTNEVLKMDSKDSIPCSLNNTNTIEKLRSDVYTSHTEPLNDSVSNIHIQATESYEAHNNFTKSKMQNRSYTFLDQFKLSVASGAKSPPSEPSLTEVQVQLLGAAACHDAAKLRNSIDNPKEVYQNVQSWISDLFKKTRKTKSRNRGGKMKKDNSKEIGAMDDLATAEKLTSNVYENIKEIEVALNDEEQSNNAMTKDDYPIKKSSSDHDNYKENSAQLELPVPQELSHLSSQSVEEPLSHSNTSLVTSPLVQGKSRIISTLNKPTNISSISPYQIHSQQNQGQFTSLSSSAGIVAAHKSECMANSVPGSPEFSQPLQPPKLPPFPFKDVFEASAISTVSMMEDNRCSNLVDDSSKHPAKPCYTCEVCNKVFGARHQLRRHSITHTNNRPYPCPYCHRAFKQKVHLTDHVKRHSGLRPFGCVHCRKSFVLKNELNQHIKNHCHGHTAEEGESLLKFSAKLNFWNSEDFN